MPTQDNTVLMEGVQLIFRNFRGKAGKFNKEGERSFAVLIPDDLAQTMLADGWNVKYLEPRDEEDTPTPYLPVAIRYDIKPPRVVVVTTAKRKNLDESDIEDLDWADIVNADLIVRPFVWEVNGKTGIKAYVQSMYVTIREDALEMKYSDLAPAESH